MFLRKNRNANIIKPAVKNSAFVHAPKSEAENDAVSEPVLAAAAPDDTAPAVPEEQAPIAESIVLTDPQPAAPPAAKPAVKPPSSIVNLSGRYLR
jgi:hypothetical protein